MKKNFFSDRFLASLQPRGEATTKDKQGLQKVSIVMPTFNQVRFIERSILSVLNQDYQNIELIIIDGGSSDGTIDIIKKYQKHIAYWLSEPDHGQSDALNKGFARANGEVFGWLNSDDLYLPNSVSLAVNSFQEHPDKNIVFGDWLSIDEFDGILDLNHAFDFSLNHFKYEGFHLNAQSMFWRSNVHKSFSGFDINLYNTMDYQMILEFGIKQGEFRFLRIPTALGAFRRYEGQKTSGFPARVLAEHFNMAVQYGYSDKYAPVGKIKRYIYRIRRTYWYTKRGGLGLLRRRLKEAYFGNV